MCDDCNVCRAWLEESVRQAMFGASPNQDDVATVGGVDLREEYVRQAQFGFARNEKGEQVQFDELVAQGNIQQPERCPACHCLLT